MTDTPTHAPTPDDFPGQQFPADSSLDTVVAATVDQLLPSPRVTVGRDRSKRGPVNFSLAPHIIPLLGYWGQLDRVYDGFKKAGAEVEKARGAPVCVPGCGKCCEETVPLSTGVEAEYAASLLLGSRQLATVLDRARDWLISKPTFKATYGSKVTQELFDSSLAQEVDQVLMTESCPFLDEEKRCLVHNGRPATCRAYSTTHVPNTWCPRPVGIGEDVDSRISWDASVPLEPGTASIKQQYDDMRRSIGEPRYSREGFFPMLVYERFRAADLAGLVDDGRIPVARMTVGWGGSKLLLWQEQLDREWSHDQADLSISQQVPLVEVDGKLTMRIG